MTRASELVPQGAVQPPGPGQPTAAPQGRGSSVADLPVFYEEPEALIWGERSQFLKTCPSLNTGRLQGERHTLVPGCPSHAPATALASLARAEDAQGVHALLALPLPTPSGWE